MLKKLKGEIKIAGANFFLVSGAFAAFLTALAILAGDLMDYSAVGFEVLFPFYTAMAASEWGKTRADRNFPVIAAQSPSMFSWVFLRWLAIFAATGLLAVCCMLVSGVFRQEGSVWEMLLVYFPTAFFFSSLCALAGILWSREHVAALTGGLLWLTALFTRGLLRFPGVEYVYPFLQFAGDQNRVLVWNKGILTAAGLLTWGGIWLKCRKGLWF